MDRVLDILPSQSLKGAEASYWGKDICPDIHNKAIRDVVFINRSTQAGLFL